MCSTGSSARRTNSNPPLANQETTHERTRQSRRLWRAERARHADDPAHAARPDRAGLGLSHRERSAPQMAGGGRDGDEGRRAVRVRLAQQRAHRSAGQAPRGLWRGAPDGEPDHRARSAAQARLHLGKGQRRRFVRARAEGREGAADRGPPPPARPRHDGRRQHRLARASRHAGRTPRGRGVGAVLGPVQPPQDRIRPAHPG